MKDKKIVAETSTRPVNTSIKNTSEFIKPLMKLKLPMKIFLTVQNTEKNGKKDGLIY